MDRDAAASREIEAHRGQLIQSTEDGLMATFDRPAAAIRLRPILGPVALPYRLFGRRTADMAGDRDPSRRAHGRD